MPEVMNRRAAFVLGSLERRRKGIERDLDDALRYERWSRVAGLDGIRCGLLMAETLIRDEFKRKRRG